MNQDITTSHEDNSDITDLSKLSKLFEILSQVEYLLSLTPITSQTDYQLK